MAQEQTQAQTDMIDEMTSSAPKGLVVHDGGVRNIPGVEIYEDTTPIRRT